MRIAEDEREVLAGEARVLATAVEGERAEVYRRLAEAAEAGDVPDEWDEDVGRVTSLALETGRARAVHGPGGVRALAALWRRTESGRRAARDAEELTEALRGLRGLPLRSVAVSAPAPGTFALVIEAGDYEVRLRGERGTLRLQSLTVGGGGVGE